MIHGHMHIIHAYSHIMCHLVRGNVHQSHMTQSTKSISDQKKKSPVTPLAPQSPNIVYQIDI